LSVALAPSYEKLLRLFGGRHLLATWFIGLLSSAAAQTAAASFAQFVAAVPHWPVLALVTFILAMVQIGPILVWAPIAIWLWVDGQTAMAVFMAGRGLVVVGLIDNIVRAVIVSRASELPALLALLGAIGGLVAPGNRRHLSRPGSHGGLPAAHASLARCALCVTVTTRESRGRTVGENASAPAANGHSLPAGTIAWETIAGKRPFTGSKLSAKPSVQLAE
jgi:hypothetical protein